VNVQYIFKRWLAEFKERGYWARFGGPDKSNIDRSRYLRTILKEKTVIQSIVWNSDRCVTDLCLLGLKYPTDKSPLTIDSWHRHSYTPVYSLLFSPLKNREINLAEIGTLNGHGLQMFREFFPRATLRGFECDTEMRQVCENLGLEDTKIHFIDVRDEESIREAFDEAGLQFDIIFDDSSHLIEDQLRIIRYVTPYLKPGGMMIIEDIFDDDRSPEHRFESVIEEFGDTYAFSSFIYPENRRSYVGDWNNEKLLLLIKS